MKRYLILPLMMLAAMSSAMFQVHAQTETVVVVKSADDVTLPFKIAMLQQVNIALNEKRVELESQINLMERYAKSKGVASPVFMEKMTSTPASKIDPALMKRGMTLYMDSSQQEVLQDSPVAHQRQVLTAMWRMCYETQGELNALGNRNKELRDSLAEAGKWADFEAWVPLDLKAQEAEAKAKREAMMKKAAEERAKAEERRRVAVAKYEAEKAERERRREERRKAAREHAEAIAYINAINGRRYTAYGYRGWNWYSPGVYIYPTGYYYGHGKKKLIHEGTHQGKSYKLYRGPWYRSGYRQYYNNKTNRFYIKGSGWGLTIGD